MVEPGGGKGGRAAQAETEVEPPGHTKGKCSPRRRREGGEDALRPLPCETEEKPGRLEQHKGEAGGQRGDVHEGDGLPLLINLGV